MNLDSGRETPSRCNRCNEVKGQQIYTHGQSGYWCAECYPLVFHTQFPKMKKKIQE